MTLFEAASFRRFRRRKAVRPNERSAITKSTQSDLNRLVHTADRAVKKVKESCRPANRSYPDASFEQAFEIEMQSFSKLHARYLVEKENRCEL